MKKIDFTNYRTYEIEFAGRKLTVETGKMAQLANGSCLVRYGDTAVLVTATASQKPRDGIDFFPMSIDFEERLYSVGRIPGSWTRREGRPTEKAILSARVIDRPIRPLFPKDMRNDVAINCTIMSVDHDNLPEIVAMLGASIAISISDIPWGGPIAGAVVGLVDGQYVINPTAEQRKVSQMHVTVASSKEKVVMIEAGANEVPEDVMLEGIMYVHNEMGKLIDFINMIKAEIGRPKFEYASAPHNDELYAAIKDYALDRMRYCMDTDDKTVREDRLAVLTDDVQEHFAADYPESEALINDCLYKLQKYVVRRWLLDDQKRVDGRAMDEVRPLDAEVGLLPRAHGSGMFTRGQTQVLTVATLGTADDEQILDTIYEEETKRYMHHYNFPSYSVGEAKPSRSPGRREIGHGALAERALEPVIPSKEEFPYTIRLVSEVLSSNGSTSQGSVCGSTLALMDAGVPIKAPVAGISCGLITEDDRWMTFTDIQGVEDFFGDMDFKVAGTHDGITAIQMDLKISGLLPEMVKEALEKTHVARNYILDDIMLKAIDKPREELSPYAPKMLTTTIPADKIAEVIGKGGKVIKEIQAECEVKIDIEEDGEFGQVFVSGIDADKCKRALEIVKTIATDPEAGAIFLGKVTRIMDFGAFVEIAPGKEGLVHVSQLDVKRTENVTDVVNVGDVIRVKVLEIDDKGRLNLSRRDVLIEVDGLTPENDINEDKPRRRQGDRRGNRHHNNRH